MHTNRLQELGLGRPVIDARSLHKIHLYLPSNPFREASPYAVEARLLRNSQGRHTTPHQESRFFIHGMVKLWAAAGIKYLILATSHTTVNRLNGANTFQKVAGAMIHEKNLLDHMREHISDSEVVVVDEFSQMSMNGLGFFLGFHTT